MTDLQEIRKQIDEVDEQIVRLFERRMKLTKEVAEYKIATGKPVFDAQRERKKLETLGEKATDPFNCVGIREVFRQLMSISRKRQYQLLSESGVSYQSEFHKVDRLPTKDAKVVFQGVEGAYSFAAMNTYFGPEVDSFHVETWKDAMEAITEGKADYAVLPIENSTAGIVADIYDLLVEYQNNIVGQQIIRADHVLMGLPGVSLSDLTLVCSHPRR